MIILSAALAYVNYMIAIEIINNYKHSIKRYPADTFLFHEGEIANHYYQIISGRVKMLNINDEGKEFIQGIFEDGQSFGEPPLFVNETYPASARTLSETKICRIHKIEFFQLLNDHFDIHLSFTTVLAKRLRYKAMIMKEISSHDVEHRILTFLDHIKSEYGEPQGLFPVKFTRQQLSNLLGIRVETTIRAIKRLEEKGALKIIDRKIYR